MQEEELKGNGGYQAALSVLMRVGLRPVQHIRPTSRPHPHAPQPWTLTDSQRWPSFGGANTQRMNATSKPDPGRIQTRVSRSLESSAHRVWASPAVQGCADQINYSGSCIYGHSHKRDPKRLM